MTCRPDAAVAAPTIAPSHPWQVAIAMKRPAHCTDGQGHPITIHDGSGQLSYAEEVLHWCHIPPGSRGRLRTRDQQTPHGFRMDPSHLPQTSHALLCLAPVPAVSLPGALRAP